MIDVGHVIKALQQEQTSDEKYVGHALTGNWLSYRDCYVKPDLVLIYKVENGELKSARIGSHSELFR